MSAEQSLEKYGNAVRAMKDHQEDNKAVFEAHKKLMFNVIDAENEVRDAAAEAGVGVENGAYRVVVTPQTQTFADIEELDRAILEGKATQELRNRIVKTNTRPPRITISEIGSR